MMLISSIRQTYRYIYIIENMTAFNVIKDEYCLERDLVLTFDFKVKNSIELLNGNCEFVDHIVDKETMEANNHIIYKYFSKWYINSNNEDIFTFKGIAFGMSFRQEIWNDYVIYIRLRLSIAELKNIRSDKIVVICSSMALMHTVLDDLCIKYEKIDFQDKSDGYYFPIFKYNSHVIGSKHIKGRIRTGINKAIIIIQSVLTKFNYYNRKAPNIFVQLYHPTKKIIEWLSNNNLFRLTLSNSSDLKNIHEIIAQKIIPFLSSRCKYQDEADKMIKEINGSLCHSLILTNGDDITNSIKNIIVRCIQFRVSCYLDLLDSIIVYFDKNGLDLEVLIANIGNPSALIDAYSKAKGIPSYLIINGMLSSTYSDESKYASVINSYSTSIRDNYFKGMDNIVCLGDPRMDDYVVPNQIKKIDHVYPTITIGTSGYSPQDLNSYLAVEFIFIYDVMLALRKILQEGYKYKLLIKVRPNGYRKQYEAFFKDYFPDMKFAIVDKESMKNVLKRTDYYITIFSQSLFEASVLGIPVVYYMKVTEKNNPPFDGKSELVTVESVGALVKAIKDFYDHSPRYSEFLKYSIMEKYIGPLDGKNLERNILLIQKIIKCNNCLEIASLVKSVNVSGILE